MPQLRIPHLVDLYDGHDGGPHDEQNGGVVGEPGAVVKPKAETVDPELILGPDLAVLHNANGGGDGTEDEDESEEEAGPEGSVVELDRSAGVVEGQADGGRTNGPRR